MRVYTPAAAIGKMAITASPNWKTNVASDVGTSTQPGEELIQVVANSCIGNYSLAS
jgi:hypothetical protein